MSAISSLNSSSYSPAPATPSSAPSAASNASSGNTASSPSTTTPSNDASLVSLAASLSFSAGVVNSLGGGTGTSLSATSLLNSFINAGQKPATSTAPADANPIGSTTAGNTASDGSAAAAGNAAASGNAATSGLYDGTGTLQSLNSSDTNANWASLLKTDPALSANAVAYSFNQGILNTLA